VISEAQLRRLARTGHQLCVPDGFSLDPGATVTLHIRSGTDSSTDLYWGSASPIWNNSGDTVIVEDGSGSTVLEYPY
jgi:competence protein ComEC